MCGFSGLFLRIYSIAASNCFSTFSLVTTLDVPCLFLWIISSNSSLAKQGRGTLDELLAFGTPDIAEVEARSVFETGIERDFLKLLVKAWLLTL